MSPARRIPALLLVLCLALVTACSGPSGDRAVGPEAARTRSAATTPTADPAPPTGAGQTQDTAAVTEDTSAGSDDEAPGAQLPDGAVTALLVGTDSRDGDLGGLADVIVLAQLSADRKHLTLVSVARDSSVDVPGHGTTKINEAFARGGLPLLRETVTDLLGGLEIDLVAQTDFEVFVALTRWMDGFWVDNQHATTLTVGSTGREVVFEEGRILLEGTEGLAYVRERTSMPLGDLDRTQRHRAALAGMMERLTQIREQEPERLIELLPMLYQSVTIEGDLQLEQLMTMVDLGAELGPEDITSLMVPVSHFGTTDAGASVNILDADRTQELAEGLREGDLSEYVERHGSSYAPTGG